MATKPIPTPGPQSGWRALRALLRQGHPLAALEVFHAELGDVFQTHLPGFSAIFLVGPQAAHFLLAQARDAFLWRNERDPVTLLLRHGVLVEDGQTHDDLRHMLSPPLHRRMLASYLEQMVHSAAEVSTTWGDSGVVDMLVAMRRVALLTLMRTLYRIDFRADMATLWKPILDNIRYISPGLWMFWHDVPRPQYRRSLKRMDAYLYRIIRERRLSLPSEDHPPSDMLGSLIALGLDDDWIRDQLLTMLIAGHDTVTALMAWALYLLSTHPEARERAESEAEALFPAEGVPEIETLNRLTYLEAVLREALRLYPPIHLGNRLAARDITFEGYLIPRGSRVIYSIYLTQRHPRYWEQPHSFIPERHLGGKRPPPYTWLAFGGGPRNCIGAAYGFMEAKVVLAYVLKHYTIGRPLKAVHPSMGATLEPHPGVIVPVRRKG